MDSPTLWISFNASGALLRLAEFEQSLGRFSLCYATFIIYLCSSWFYEVGDTLAAKCWRCLGRCNFGHYPCLGLSDVRGAYGG